MRHTAIIRDLGISKSFFDNHADTIRGRILSAAKTIQQSKKPLKRSATSAGFSLDPSEISAINQCVHLASTVLFLGSDSESLKKTLSKVQQTAAFRDRDPRTVITSAMLYHLLTRIEANPNISQEDREGLKQVRERFDDINWLVSAEGVADLEIAPLKWKSAKGRSHH